MKRTWVVAADASRARIFEAGAERGELREVEHFAHPEGRAPNRALKSDGSGRLTRPGYRKGHAASAHVDPAQHELDLFTKSLGEYLDKAGGENRYDMLYVVAPPKVLGAIRRHLGKETLRRTVEEMPKDISWLSEHDLGRYLKDKGLSPDGNANRIVKGD